jgi:class 3 adenylate cyclase
MRAAADRHFALLRAAIGPHGGHVFRTQGDGLCAAFATAPPVPGGPSGWGPGA